MSEAIPQGPSAPPPPTPQGSRAFFWISLLILLGGIGFFAWSRYMNSDSVRAKKELDRADRLVADGEVEEAARVYHAVGEQLKQGSAAAARFRKLLGEPLDGVSLKKCQAVFRLAAGWPEHPELRDGLVERGMELVRAKGDDEPRDAIAFTAMLFNLAAGDQQLQQKMSQEYPQLIERWVKKHPEDVEVVTQYGRVLDQSRDSAGVVKLLEPLRDKLEHGDGALLLARAYAAQNRPEDAFALLEPLCKERMARLVKAHQSFQALSAPAEQKLLKQIEDKSAKDFEYGTYEAADENAKKFLKARYVDAMLRRDPELVKANEERLRESGVAPAVRLLAELTLTRARSSPRTDTMKSRLESLRGYLLQLRDVFPREAELYVLLGQTSFLKGDGEEGQKHLNDLLEKSGRSPEVLFQVGNTLWALGEAAAARKLVEEAYEKESEPEHKQVIALTRARHAEDVADTIAWLKKADPSKVNVQVQREQALARQAGQQGRDKDAVEHLRKALDIVAKEKESPETLAETSRNQLAIFQLTGDREAMKKGLALLEQAMEKDNDNPASPGAAAAQFLRAACVDLVADVIEPGVLRPRAELEHLNYLINDRAGRDEQIASAVKNPALVQARELARKAIEKQPRQARPYDLLNGLSFWTRDRQLMAELEKSLRDKDLDQGEMLQNQYAHFAGKHDERLKQERLAAIARWEKLIESLRQKKQDRTLAVALCGQVKSLLSGEKIGEAIDADLVVKLAEEARKILPSKATSETLVNALLYRAHGQLTQKVPEYRTMAEKARRSLDSSDFVALALTRDGPGKAAATAHPDVVRAADVLKERAEAFPDEATPWLHAMLRNFHAEAATKVAQTLRDDEFGTAARTVAIRLNPLLLSPVFEQYWALQLQGKEKDGVEMLRQIGKQGVPLPYELP